MPEPGRPVTGNGNGNLATAAAGGRGPRATGATAPPPGRPDPSFEVVAAEAVPRSSVPTLSFAVEVTEPSGAPIHFIALSALVTVEPGLRSYDAETRERLVELFGEPARWGSTTGAFRWTQVDRVVPAFSDRGRFEIPVECTYDHEIAATKYFSGVRDGGFPLRFHFNGTTYYELEGRLQMLPLAWDRSARFELPARTWRGMIEAHYPRGGWLRLSEATLRDLGRRKAAVGAPTMDECVRGLLAGAPEPQRDPSDA